MWINILMVAVNATIMQAISRNQNRFWQLLRGRQDVCRLDVRALHPSSRRKTRRYKLHEGYFPLAQTSRPFSPKDSIVISSERTLTSTEDLQKCLNAVQENVFEVSDYPVVLTLEDHLPPDLQKKVAKKVADAEELIQDENEEYVATEYKDFISIHAGNRKGELKNSLNGDPNRVIRLSMSEQ
ncbi:unnamed protein product [Eruca vesicaria subsp. sativa]|uniref:Phosphatidylinositol-specific phospholipase C X domain-containing protein n=1 Tax=Eruca vesicaria subsp. sativa TaxID=29727 RepID=A0ABC8L8W1_ERUVS|nr:unnamed protein product [Eruca vesicaria subsp. sativa]